MTHFDLVEAAPRRPAFSAPGAYKRYGKRLTDLALVLVFLPVLVPLIAILGLLVRLGGGPAFYGHRRIGHNGRSFQCWKIRTMVPDADRLLQDHLTGDPLAALEWARNFKLRKDPRITPLGRILRRTSLDELPQIWNVLRGEMSLVGPRPITAAELAFYGSDRHCYLAQRPGLTGMWQVNGRTDGCYDKRVRLDRRYLQQMSLPTDLALIGRTAFCVLARTGR